LLSFDNYEFDVLESNFERIFSKMISDLKAMIKNNGLRDKWKIDEIDQDGVKGFRVQGSFGSSEPGTPFDPLTPFEPKNPHRPLPKPKRPFARLPKRAIKKNIEPLVDIFEDQKFVRVFFEVRGANPKDITLNVTADKVEVKASNFYKTINLPNCKVDLEKVSSKCKNGVLVVEIPKIKNISKKQIKINID
jgi:HSP20 family molecular chaperone IbpA